MKKDIRAYEYEELQKELERLGEKPFRAKQIYEWLHVKLADRFDEMTNLSVKLREKLAEEYDIFPVQMAERQQSKLDGTNKFLFRLYDGNMVESVLMRYKHGNSVCISSQAVNDHARANGYRVVREIGGHGCGLEFHEDPWVSYVTKRGTEMALAPGMIFTIEPMVNMGTDEVGTHPGNTWEIFTADGKPSAQWEIMVLVTDTGHEVLSW